MQTLTLGKPTPPGRSAITELNRVGDAGFQDPFLLNTHRIIRVLVKSKKLLIHLHGSLRAWNFINQKL